MCRILILTLLLALGGCKTARQLGRMEQANQELKEQLLTRVLVRDSIVRIPGDTIRAVDTLALASGGRVVEHWYHTRDSVKVFQDNPTVTAEWVATRSQLEQALARSVDLQADVAQLRRREVSLWVAVVVAAFLLGVVIAIAVRLLFKI